MNMIRSVSTATKTIVKKETRMYATEATAQPFATALADFMAPSHYEQQQDEERMARQSGPVWSERLSYASPMTDFTAEKAANEKVQNQLVWTDSYSFASPEADFTSAPRLEENEEWSGDISFASPNADFVSADIANSPEAIPEEWSEVLSYSSPDSDFVAATTHELADEMASYNAKENFINHVIQDENRRMTMAYALSFAEAESDFTSEQISNFIDDRTKSQLMNSQDQLRTDRAIDEARTALESIALPKTFAEAMAPTNQAIVVTEPIAPFRIVEVNAAWEGLCGFSREESLGKTLGILQGPETDRDAANAVVHTVMEDQEEAGIVLTNYSKTGRKFTNNLRMGVLRDEGDRITHFVGVLEEIDEEPAQIQASA